MNTGQFSPKMPERTPKTVLILGNGFDLDLGMHTSYKSFATNEKYWPFRNKIYHSDGMLSKFLNDKRDTESWFDIEAALAEYARVEHEHKNIQEDKKCFNMLVNALQGYIQNEQDSLKFCKNGAEGVPMAKTVLEHVSKKPDYHIFSFNYTDVFKIAKMMFIDLDRRRIEYIHGSLATNDIILGTGDVEELPEDYYWLYKSFNTNYRSNNLAETLADADEVFIFGHSLGKNDHDYFIDFFHDAIHERKSQFLGPGKLILRIYTRDEDGEYSLKKQLMTLTDRHLQGLYARSDFEFRYTNGDVTNVQ